MSKKQFYVTHCLKKLIMPKIYERKFYADKNCQKHNLDLASFKQKNLAEEFYEQKLKDFIQGTYIDKVQRLQRQKFINQNMQRLKISIYPFESIHFSTFPDDFFRGYFHGSSKGNPGPSSVGYIIKKSTQKPVVQKGVFIGPYLTNNQAELTALYILMSEAYCNGVNRLNVYGLSLLTINFMKGIYVCKHPNVKKLYEANHELKLKIKQIEFKHIKNENNEESHTLAGLAQMVSQKTRQGTN